MKIVYSPEYNYDLGLLGALHPFDGTKFRKVAAHLRHHPKLPVIAPPEAMPGDVIEAFISADVKATLSNKTALLRALEFPNLPLLSYAYIRRKVIDPMRWGVAGTYTAAQEALTNGTCWNLAGGYHHASPNSIEGFCLFNDIGICYQELIKNGLLNNTDQVLIIDTDAHHGNGNAQTFMDNPRVTLLDVYNRAIYPTDDNTRRRVDINIPLAPYTYGQEYLTQYQRGLRQLHGGYALAFVVAGTDVLATDRLGQLNLSIEDVIDREKRTLEQLSQLGIPTVMVGGGGYSRESAQCLAETLLACQRF